MNWKNVLFLMRVERKSGRLVRGVKTTRYRESGLGAYWPYLLAVAVGVIGGLFANALAALVYSSGTPVGVAPLAEAAVSFFVATPTIVLLFCVVLTMLQQIQISGAKATTQVMYWLPITWQENTLASILANLLGFPVGVVLGFASGILVFSAFNGLIAQGVLTTLAVLAAAFMASSLTEIIRILQVRFTGAVYKSSGRAAVWVRFIGLIVVIVVFYTVYALITSGFTSFVSVLTQIQTNGVFVPFVWVALALFYLVQGAFLEGILFVVLSALFIAGLYYLAVLLNMRFGLYEPPAIKVQKSGIYAPKAGFLGRLGFSTVEAALIHKDLRAFTRRRELMQIFIFPIAIIVIFLVQSLGVTNSGAPSAVGTVYFVLIFLFPSGAVSMTLGNSLIGEEGQAVWRIYASPISAQNLVKSKLFFLVLISTIILIITGAVGIAFYHPSLLTAILASLESFFIIPAIGSVALAIGFKGADFSAVRRARMIRPTWAIISLIACGLAGLAVLAPLVPFLLSVFASTFMEVAPMSMLDVAVSVASSGIVAAIITFVFYRVNLNSARELLRKAEM
ncbi:MAG: hypothetical protein NWE98_06840 [Candidatus Bathyarchaeota archaeon]|nr:hypothetical protein [Candidatus Bathyarchaeota archaeon]